jgi:hypothetical protein
VAVANGVVYFQSTFTGTLYAVDAHTGAILAAVNIDTCDGSLPYCGQTSGPSISRGQVYVGVGNILTSLFLPSLAPNGGAIVALGIDDHHSPAKANDRAPVADPALRAAKEGAGDAVLAISRWSNGGDILEKLYSAGATPDASAARSIDHLLEYGSYHRFGDAHSKPELAATADDWLSDLLLLTNLDTPPR